MKRVLSLVLIAVIAITATCSSLVATTEETESVDGVSILCVCGSSYTIIQEIKGTTTYGTCSKCGQNTKASTPVTQFLYCYNCGDSATLSKTTVTYTCGCF